MVKIINISVASVLAIHSMALIAGNKQRLKAERIAAITGLSRNHLAKVLQQLVRNNYIKSGRGPKGGFELKMNADQIYLIDIYRLFEGAVDDSPCLYQEENCQFGDCIFGGLTGRFTREFIKYLETKRISDITNNLSNSKT